MERPEPPSLSEEVAELKRLARFLVAGAPDARAPGSLARYRAAGLSLGIARDLAADAEERVRDGMPRERAEHDAPAVRLEAQVAPVKLLNDTLPGLQ